MKLEEKTFETEEGDEFTFLFDIEGLIAIEDCANQPTPANPNGTNFNLSHILSGAQRGRYGFLRAVVFGGLLAHHPTVTKAQAAALIESDGKALGAALWPALLSAMPEDKGDTNPRKAAKSGTGSRSSPPGSKKASPRNASGSRRRGASRLS